jgi:hypothetical protein
MTRPVRAPAVALPGGNAWRGWRRLWIPAAWSAVGSNPLLVVEGSSTCNGSGAIFVFGGEGGIRTHGGLPLNGFQDRRFRPLSHLSVVFGLHRVKLTPVGAALGYRNPASVDQPISVETRGFSSCCFITWCLSLGTGMVGRCLYQPFDTFSGNQRISPE